MWELSQRLAPPAALALLLTFAAAHAPRAAQRLSARREKGGVYFLFAVRAEPTKLEAAVARTVEVMRARCLKLRARCDVRRADEPGRVRVKVEAPHDPARVRAVLMAGGMEVRPVVSPGNPAPLNVYRTRADVPGYVSAQGDVLPYESEDGKSCCFVVVERAPLITGDDVRDAELYDLSLRQRPARYEVFFKLKPEGAARFAEWTRSNLWRYIAIILDGRVRTAPYVVTQMSDEGIIGGRFTREQALDTALVLASGNLPAPLELVEEGRYSPTGDA